MKRISLLILLAICLACTGALATGFTLSGPGLQPGGTLPMAQVYRGYGCTGGNLSPELHWSGEPAGTRSFALILFDPDAPTGHGWYHWLVYNIPATIHRLAVGSGDPTTPSLPEGTVQGRNDFGETGYGGACPPVGHGTHRYRFTLWALDTPVLTVPGAAGGAALEAVLRRHVLGRAELVLTYGR